MTSGSIICSRCATEIAARGEGALAESKLSPREQEVLMLLLTGKRLKQIAIDLAISVKTVTTHRARLLRKLQLDDNLGLYRFGLRNGLIEL